MSNETQASNFPGYFSTNNGDQLAASIALAGLTKESPLDEVAANGVCNLREQVSKAEASLKDTIHAQSIANGAEFCGLNKAVLSDGSLTRLNLANAERDLQNRIHEARLEALKTNTELSKYLSDKSDIVKEKISAFERNVDENFCKVRTEIKDSERRILDRLSADKLDEKNEIIESLRHERYADKSAYQFGLQNQEIATLKQMINSVEQTQKFSSKTVQFGAGNVAIPTQTANQG